MEKFKIGDRVRVKSDQRYWGGVEGVVCGVDEKYVYFHQDEGAKFRDGQTVHSVVDGHGFRHSSLELLPVATTPTPDERAVALVRKIAKGDWSPGYETEAEARAIVAALEPVDEDLIEARKMAADIGIPGRLWTQINEGMEDDQPLVFGIRAGIAKGRQLQRDTERVRGEG